MLGDQNLDERPYLEGRILENTQGQGNPCHPSGLYNEDQITMQEVSNAVLSVILVLSSVPVCQGFINTREANVTIEFFRNWL